MTQKVFLTAITVFAFLFSAKSEVKLNGLFGNGAVLQQKASIPIWGTANDGEKITVQFDGQEVSTVAKNGRWLVRLKPAKAGGPFSLTVKGDNTISLTNILVGEVWLCSGQSNMAFKLSRTDNAAEASAAANDPQLRFFTVPHDSADEPRQNVSGEWKESTPQSASDFSAVAYFFGRDLRRALKVPIGLIDASVGGTPAEAWTSREALAANPALKEILDNHLKSVQAYKAAQEKSDDKPASKKSVEKSKPVGKAAATAAKKPTNPAETAKRPAGLYNAMIAPLQPYAIAGAIWYQGEANGGRALQYQTLFPAMIQNWRSAWKKEFPFLFVQIAPYHLMNPEIREAQLIVSQKVPKTAMAVTADVGEDKDIHPKKKEPVGARLALAARAIAYGEKIEFSGPVFSAMKTDGAKAVLSFTHTTGGLVAKDGALKGFTVAGDDGNFVPAPAKIEGNKVVVTNPSGSKIASLQYGWAKTPDVNLFNGSGLPASPFRTDAK